MMYCIYDSRFEKRHVEERIWAHSPDPEHRTFPRRRFSKFKLGFTEQEYSSAMNEFDDTTTPTTHLPCHAILPPPVYLFRQRILRTHPLSQRGAARRSDLLDERRRKRTLHLHVSELIHIHTFQQLSSPTPPTSSNHSISIWITVAFSPTLHSWSCSIVSFAIPLSRPEHSLVGLFTFPFIPLNTVHSSIQISFSPK